MELRELRRFDDGWRFYLGDAQGGEQTGTPDSNWRGISLPHDWSAEDLPGTDSPFDREAVGGRSTGFAVGGIGWYRKHFMVPSDARGRRVHLQFDGVYMKADVWLNGVHLGSHPYGYTSFFLDLTPNVNFGGDNLLAVKVDNSGKNTRWYSGSGIYRHLWLTVTGPIHVSHWGVCVTTPEVSEKSATVRVRTKVANESANPEEVTLRLSVLDPKGKSLSKDEKKNTIPMAAEAEFDQSIAVKKPSLWGPDSPSLYRAVCEVVVGGRVVDRVETSFGIRSVSVNAVEGFKLNGKPVLLKGACMHHDNGVLGAAAYDDAEERRVRLMKENGYNAIRTAHNPPSPAFLDACDRMGILVIDEAFDMWEVGKNSEDYHLYFKDWCKADIESMVLRDRNHPSVVFWSIGNEIPERGKEEGMRNAKMLASYVRAADPTRPVTEAVCGVDFPWENLDAYFANLDVGGYNYQYQRYKPDHERVPERVMMATESFPMEAFDYWMCVKDHSWVIGDFVWTGFDYLGEAAIGWWSYDSEPKDLFPWTVAYCADLDLCGFKRPSSFYRDILWETGAKVSAFVHNPVPTFGERKKVLWGWDDVLESWNWPGMEGKSLKVDVYSACERVQLFLNGRDLGEKPTSRETRYMASWDVPYEPGVLKAVGFDGKKKTAEWELKTAGEPAKIKLTAEKTVMGADSQSLCFVRAEVLDAAGVRHARAEVSLKFQIEGEGYIAGIGNGNPISTESFQRLGHRTFEGRCLAVIKGSGRPGEIKLTASSSGLAPDSVTVTAK